MGTNPPVPVDLDTIKYPYEKPSLVFSVSGVPYQEAIHGDTPQDIYVEKYALTKYLESTVPAGLPHRTHFRLFTHELSLEGSASSYGFGLHGSNGSSSLMKGVSGGDISLYVEDTASLDVQRLKTFKLDASGGDGFSPPHVPNEATGKPGGDGGSGGNVTVWLGQDLTINNIAEIMSAIVARIKAAHKPTTWPATFKQDSVLKEKLAKLIEFSKNAVVSKMYKIPWTSTDAVFAGTEQDFKNKIRDMYLIFKTSSGEDDKLGLLEKSMIYKRGSYGQGSRGDTGDGQNGKDGRDGVPSASWLAVSKMLEARTCFAHPAQCQMLLDKAKVFYFLGNANASAKSRHILERLETRLLFLGGDQANIADSILAGTYQILESPLSIDTTSAPVRRDTDNDKRAQWQKDQDREPAGVRQLRTIRDEARRMRLQIESGLDYYGSDGDTIPNLTFETYQQALRESVASARNAETSFSSYQSAANDTAAKRAALITASTCISRTKEDNVEYYKRARRTVEDNADKIENLALPLERSRKQLEAEVEAVQRLIRDAFSISLKDAVSAIGQVLFTPGKMAPVMAGLELADLVEDASARIENELGQKLKKSYLIRKIKRSTETTLKGLFEQFTVSADGTVALKDGDTTKLVMAEQDLEKMIDGVADKLNGDTTGSRVKEKFDQYIALVKDRNDAVLKYNSALALMIKYETERDTILKTSAGIANQMKQLDSANPMLLLFMKRLYTDAVANTQLMIYRAQKALSFEYLVDFNAMANLSEYSASHLTAEVLDAARQNLANKYLDLKGNHRPRQSFRNIKYHLNEVERDGLQVLPSGNIKLLVSVQKKRGGPFEGKADVRLTKVRFYIRGARTTDPSKQLKMTLTHESTETIFDEHGRPHRFSHPKILVSFSHHTQTMAIGDSDGTIGERAEKDGYAIVGPFTSWWIDIRKSNNPGLKLDKNIKAAWFEFDGEARAVVSS